MRARSVCEGAGQCAAAVLGTALGFWLFDGFARRSGVVLHDMLSGAVLATISLGAPVLGRWLRSRPDRTEEVHELRRATENELTTRYGRLRG